MLRLLSDEHDIGIDERESSLTHLTVGLCEQDERVGAGVAIVVGREQRADVRKTCRRRAARRSAHGR